MRTKANCHERTPTSALRIGEPDARFGETGQETGNSLQQSLSVATITARIACLACVTLALMNLAGLVNYGANYERRLAIRLHGFDVK